MPSRVVQHHTREESPPSESEKSFVSAASENTSDWSNKDSRIGQSAAAALPSPPRHSVIAPSHSSTLGTPQASNKSPDLTAGLQALSPSSSTSPTPLAPQIGSYFAQQPGASGNEARSPPNRRPPASRSSHGIETFSGPPPALSTRRSYNAESPWRNPPSSDQRAIQSPVKHSSSIDSIVRQTYHTANEHIGYNISEGARSAQPRKSSIAEGGSVAMDGRYDVHSGSEEDRDSTLRINGHKAKNGRHARNENGQQQSQSSHEDLFLNLARADSVIDDGPEPSNRSERRRSRIRGSSLQQSNKSRPSSSHRPSTSVGSFGQQVSPMHSNHHEPSFNPSFHDPLEKNLLSSFRDSSAKSRSYAASAHPLDQRHRTGNNRTSLGGSTRDDLTHDRSLVLPLGGGRRRSIREPSPGIVGLGYKHSNLSYTSNGDYGSSYFSGQQDQSGEVDEDPQTPHAEGTESTVSTTAPSTVWDELEDMKSRIRKLEITGKIPASSNAAMSSTLRERPPTATTTMTTNSLSPKRRHMKNVSPEASTLKSPEVANLHPLLHASLAKTKLAISANLYKALDATASDALTLAAMAGNTSARGVSPSTASIAGTSSGLDRQLCRKADNMCRSLTELCIALAEETPETGIAVGKTRTGSKDANAAAQRNEPSLQDLRSFRATSDEPDFRSSSRVISRLEARRTSLALGSSPLSRMESPQEAPTPIEAVPPASSRLDRKSSVNHRGRASEDQGDTISSKRPPSRAMTEIGQIRHSPQTRISREYTSQHPMPNHPQRSPSVQSSLPTRKSYFPPVSQSPLTPNVQPGNRRYLDHSTPPSSADSSRLAEARQRRIASLGQHTSAGQSRIGIASGRLRKPEVEQ
ncbi:MAG: hypothetical protein ASARMPREDX12_003143 [Alectoria sarmentosa]|nr:MAG: hypothetical protein ASARMPRED_001831 [Alectoria sarmentosa]CAD6588059.1 MAG: hypothetical protein ASARMPREDX12_003143 [Alectoria sarmentosa]